MTSGPQSMVRSTTTIDKACTSHVWVARPTMVWCGAGWCGVGWDGVAWCGVVWCGVVCGVWYGVWYGMVCCCCCCC